VLREPIERYELEVRAADRFTGRVPVEALGRAIPGEDRAVGGRRQDRFARRLDDRDNALELGETVAQLRVLAEQLVDRPAATMTLPGR
jgi:hypothetical protein